MSGQMADFGFNLDNQADNSGFSFDGSGSMLGEASGGLFGGDTLAYDPEERLVSVTQGSSTLLANAYDGAGMRAIKTAGAGTVYFLDDASGAPVVEETYTSSPTPTTTLSKINVFGADGLRQRYTVTGGGSETFYLYDPQGTQVSRIVSGDQAVKYDNEVFTDLSVWDGYGQQRSDQWTAGTIDRQYTADDPVGFEGQAGYYQDWELAKSSNPAQYLYLTTTPSLLTRRYYDASTGRFVSRDPIGYQGGQNLYAYCGGNPVNETDPEGTSGFGSWWHAHVTVPFMRGLLGTIKPGTATLGASRGDEGLDADEMSSGGASQLVQHPQAAAQNLNSGINETYVQASIAVGGAFTGGEGDLGASLSFPYPNSAFERVAFGGNELSDQAILYRQGQRLPKGSYNVVVFKLKGASGTLYRAFRSIYKVGHAEQIGWDQLFSEGYTADDVEAVYTERHPCTIGPRNCSQYLHGNLSGVSVSYSFLSNAEHAAAMK